MTTNLQSFEKPFHVGKFIIALLEEKKMTKRQLAARLEMSEVNVFKILKKKYIGMDLLSRILEILEMKAVLTVFHEAKGKEGKEGEIFSWTHIGLVGGSTADIMINIASEETQGDLSLMVEEQNMTILELEVNISNLKSEIKSYIDAMSLLTINPPETIPEKLAYSKVKVMTERFKNILGDSPKKK
jgi:hypothetical protein